MILHLPINRGFSFRPFCVIPSRSPKGVKEARTAHEMTHYNRQCWFPVWWVIKYFCSKQFRMQEETLAFRRQIYTYCQTYPNARDYYTEMMADAMANEYWGMCTWEEALEALSSGH